MRAIKIISLSATVLLVALIAGTLLMPRSDRVMRARYRTDRISLMSAVFAQEMQRLGPLISQANDRPPAEYECQSKLYGWAILEGPENFRLRYHRISDDQFILLDPGPNGVYDSCTNDSATSGTLDFRRTGDDVIATARTRRASQAEYNDGLPLISGP